MKKLLSARFWMAITLTIGFVCGFLTKQIEGAAFTAVVLIVIRDYFQRGDRQNGVQK